MSTTSNHPLQSSVISFKCYNCFKALQDAGTFTSNGKTLTAHMYSDVEQRIIKQLEQASEERVNEPNKEGFVSYYGAVMIEESDFRDSQLNSMDEFLPEAKEHMKEMLKSMNEGEDE
ncbi:hypothetical protein [Ornithinibacillus xuwenensis]|uniref:Uncharacterized protein n=1 Tax=Ornithinibacillus xuwenensis TaxID=3144668 RepID=A0ABU9XLD9_9BACI